MPSDRAIINDGCTAGKNIVVFTSQAQKYSVAQQKIAQSRSVRFEEVTQFSVYFEW
jgi:hypothetical protein